jgi:hypothetical protein
MSEVDAIPPVPLSILKKKSRGSYYVDPTSRIAFENDTDENGSKTTSIVKRPKVPENEQYHNINSIERFKKPSTKALAIVPQGLNIMDVYQPSREEEVNNRDLSSVSGNKISRNSKRQGKNFFGDTPIIDASYKEMIDENVNEQSEHHFTSEGFKAARFGC